MPAIADNPLVGREGFQKITSKFKSKKKKEETITVAPESFFVANLVGMNDAIPICAEACACCWDKAIPNDYQGRAEYIAKRSRTGHTSIIEHSNIVILLSLTKNYMSELIELLDSINYLHTKTIFTHDYNVIHVLIGGSFRGFSDIFMNISNISNPLFLAVTSVLKTYTHSAPFEDIIKLGLLRKEEFLNVEPTEDESGSHFRLLTDKEAMRIMMEDEYTKVIGIDSISKLYTNIIDIEPNLKNELDIVDLLPFVTISVLFKNMSRTCTHQLVRHRNAITQESQRYVDYSGANFTSPAKFKPEKYDTNYKYTVPFGTGPNQKMTLSELGSAICKIYDYLRNPSHAGEGHDLLKEDARAFLPSNVQCGKIYITFTFKNFLKFLKLREDPAAQAEIRTYARSIGDKFRSAVDIGTDYDYYVSTPRSTMDKYFMRKIEVDENMIEDVIDITAEDYLKAAGLPIDNIE